MAEGYKPGDRRLGGAGDLAGGTKLGVLTVVNADGTISSAVAGSTMTNPMTTKGDIIYEDGTLTPARLALANTDGWVLTVNHATGLPEWRVASGGGGGGNVSVTNGPITADSNDNYSSVLVAGGAFSDHFLGASLNVAWSQLLVAPTAGVVANSAYGVRDSSNASTGIMRAFVPGAGVAFRHEAKLRVLANLGTGILIKDSGAGETGDGMIVNIEPTRIALYSLDAGTYNLRFSVSMTFATWLYLRIDRDAANNWSGYVSVDRSLWYPIGTYAKTLTVAKAGIRNFFNAAGEIMSIDFYDCVS